MYKTLTLLIIGLSYLVGCNSAQEVPGEDSGCDTYARKTSLQSDVTIFVPYKDSLIVEDAVECLGTPEFYRADISLSSDAPSRQDVHEFRYLSLNRIYYVPPNSEPADVADSVYRAYNPTVQQERIRTLHSWNGWENIEIIYELDEAP